MPRFSDDRLLVCRGIYRDSDGSFGDNPSGVLRWIVGDSGSIGGVPLVNGGRKLLRAPELIDTRPIGYGWNQHRPDGTVRIKQPEQTVKDLDYEYLGYGFEVDADSRVTVEVAGAADHVLRFAPNGGGMIDSWIRNGYELLNRGPAGQELRRGIQAGLEWTDDVSGEFTRHLALQGGDLHTAGGARGGRMLYLTEKHPEEGGVVVTTSCIPIELDPGGSLGIPFVKTWHGGKDNRPVYWRDLRLTVELWVNWQGIDDLHRFTVTVDGLPVVRSAFFDMALYLAGFFVPDDMKHLAVYDIFNDAETFLSSGISGVPGYQDEWRRYLGGVTEFRGDDEGSTTATPTASDRVGVGYTDQSNYTAMWAQYLNPADSPLASPRDLASLPHGNGWSWLQNRVGTSGPTGQQTACVAPGIYFSNRIHPQSTVRTMGPGSASFETYFVTGPWSTAKKACAFIP